MFVRVSCPACRVPLQVPGELVDKLVRCGGCQQPFAVRVPAALGTSPASRSLRLDIGAATSVGAVRTNNEDSLLIQHLHWAGQSGRHEFALLLVADGMGGHASGERASALARTALARSLMPWLVGLIAGEEPLPDSSALLENVEHGLWEAHRLISRTGVEEPDCAGMGATAVLALIHDGLCAIGHVGDCRAYLCRHGETATRTLTRDQTLAMRLVELGNLSEAEARRHPSASQVLQALGRQYDLEPARQVIELQAGDVLVLACDGLHAHLDNEAINRLMRQDEGGAREAAERLVRATDEAGGSDNCTVIVVRCR